ncbi:coiled-coil-helix-coiled-coil-helix domain-containing protein 7 [Arapaima gigas]
MSLKAGKFKNLDSNPCIEESEGSRRCLDANNYNRDMCAAYFIRYKKCRKYWHNIMVQRRRDGVKPDMPTYEERKRILEAMGEKPY